MPPCPSAWKHNARLCVAAMKSCSCFRRLVSRIFEQRCDNCWASAFCRAANPAAVHTGSAFSALNLTPRERENRGEGGGGAGEGLGKGGGGKWCE